MGDDLGQGPALVVDPEHVAALAVQLARVDDAAIEAAFADIDFESLEP